MFRSLYVGHLQVEIQRTDQLYKMCGRLSGDWVGEGWGGERDLFVTIMVTMTQGCYKWIFSLEKNPLVTPLGHGTHY